MTDVRFLWRRFRETDTKRIWQTARRVARKTHRPVVVVFSDIMRCIFTYGTGYVDYEAFEMYDMTKEQREGFLTIGRNNQLVAELNDPAYRGIFDNKAVFNERFDKFLKRDWMVLDGKNSKEFDKLLREKGQLIVKPLDQSCGRGIEKIVYENGMDTESIYNDLYRSGCVLAEEVVVQCAEMDTLCDTSVNTIRLVTIYNSDDDVAVAAGAIRMGRAGNYVDNFNHGGLAVILDVSTGLSATDGYDKERITYKTVPEIGTVLKGFKTPQWEECKQLVMDAARVVPQVRYVAWDVAVSKDKGPLLIEGNDYPGQDVTQYPKLGLGTYAALRKLIK
jgi:hypothetical protein